jgi:hypothetical protein
VPRVTTAAAAKAQPLGPDESRDASNCCGIRVKMILPSRLATARLRTPPIMASIRLSVRN